MTEAETLATVPGVVPDMPPGKRIRMDRPLGSCAGLVGPSPNSPLLALCFACVSLPSSTKTCCANCCTTVRLLAWLSNSFDVIGGGIVGGLPYVHSTERTPPSTAQTCANEAVVRPASWAHAVGEKPS